MLLCKLHKGTPRRRPNFSVLHKARGQFRQNAQGKIHKASQGVLVETGYKLKPVSKQSFRRDSLKPVTNQKIQTILEHLKPVTIQNCLTTARWNRFQSELSELLLLKPVSNAMKPVSDLSCQTIQWIAYTTGPAREIFWQFSLFKNCCGIVRLFRRLALPDVNCLIIWRLALLDASCLIIWQLALPDVNCLIIQIVCIFATVSIKVRRFKNVTKFLCQNARSLCKTTKKKKCVKTVDRWIDKRYTRGVLRDREKISFP